MNKRILKVIASIVVVISLTACNGALKLDFPTQASRPAPETNQPDAEAESEGSAPEGGTFGAIDLLTLQSAYESIYAKVLPSVVSITVSKTISQNLPNIPGLPDGFDFGNGQEDQQAPEFQQSGAGSGFVWDKDGHIVTNNHVIDGADLIRVNFSDGRSVKAEVVGKDSQSDLAVLKIEAPADELNPIEVADSTRVKIGQIVIAIGNPFRLSGSMTTGIISGVGRSLLLDSLDMSGLYYSIPDVIQTDAAINPGNSGGVLVDIKGKLVGVTTAIESPVRANSGIGYVVPSVIVQKVVPILISDGFYEQPWIGISGNDMVPEIAEIMDLEANQQGALVVDVTAGSPADKAGLKGSATTAKIDGQEIKVGGDVITSADGKPVLDFEDLVAFLARYAKVGQTITLSVLRNGKSLDVQLTLEARPSQNEPSQTLQPEETASGAWLGIQGADMTPAIAEAMSLDSDTIGTLVIQVTAGSPADKAGIRGGYKPFDDGGRQTVIGGDVITAVDGEAVSGIQSLVDILGGYETGEDVTVTLLRDGKSIKIEVTLDERPAN